MVLFVEGMWLDVSIVCSLLVWLIQVINIIQN